MLLLSNRWGACPPSPTHSLVRRKTLPGEGTAGGAYHSSPPAKPSRPPSPFLCWGRNSGSKVRHAPACLHTQNTQLSLGLSTEGAEQEHRLGHGGLLLPLPARTQDAHVARSRHVHTLALEAEDVGGDGLDPSPGGTRKQFRRPWVGGQEGPVPLATDVGFVQIKKKDPRQLQTPDSQMGAFGCV